MATSDRPEPVRAFNLGDRVRIKDYLGETAKVVELRGALGPGGEEVYRVRVRRKPYTSHIELMESQLELVSPADAGKTKEAGSQRGQKAREQRD